MPIEAECPLCGNKGSVPEKFDGKQVKCPECCNLFIVSGPTVNGPAKTSGSQAGTIKVPTGGSQAGTMKVPSGGSQAGSLKVNANGNGAVKKVASNGSASGQHKIKPAAPTQHGTMKNPTAGSVAGQQKLPSNGSASGQHKVKPNGASPPAAPKIKPTGGSAHGTQKIKPAAGSAQGTLKKPSSAQGTQKKPAAPAKPARKKSNLDPFGSFTYDDDKGERQVRRKRRGRRMGNFVALLALIGFFSVVAVAGWFVYDHFKSGGKPDELWPKVVAVFARKGSDDKTDPGAAATKPEAVDPKIEDEPKVKKVEPPVLANASKEPAVVGDMQISIASLLYEVPPVKDVDKKDKRLIIKLKVENKGSSRLDFHGFGTEEPINKENPPTLTDDTGKAYPRVTFGPGVLAEGMVGDESAQGGKAIDDLIVFEAPPGNVPFVRLELSAENLSMPYRKIQLLIPNTMLAKLSLPVAKPDVKVDNRPDKKPEMEPEPAEVAIVKAGLKSKLPGSRIEALNRLAELGPPAAGATPDLVEVLEKDENEKVRKAACETLAKFGPRAAKLAVPVLILVVKKDEAPEVRAEAANTLAKIGVEFKDEALTGLKAAGKKEADEKALTAIKAAVEKLEKAEKVMEEKK